METNSDHKSCLCCSIDYTVLACSGACDLGLITDSVARRLRDRKIRKMSCLAMAGAGIGIDMEAFKTANILVIDGCPTGCGKKILDREGFTNYHHLRITDLGFIKGETPVTEEVINAIYEKAMMIF